MLVNFCYIMHQSDENLQVFFTTNIAECSVPIQEVVVGTKTQYASLKYSS